MAHRNRRRLGAHGEALAERHLVELGYRVLERNVHLRRAEIDLLALEGRTLCIVEVRTRSGSGFGSPEESIDARKRARLARAARQLYSARALPAHDRVRFDVVAVELGGGAPGIPPRIRVWRDAFQLDPA